VERLNHNQETVDSSPISAFYRHSTANPDRIALVVGGSSYTYGELAGISKRVAGFLGRPARVGVLASRSLEAYVGILGTLWSGAAYVPINPKVPEERLIQILRITQLDALIVDSAGADHLSTRVLENAPRRILAGSVPPSLQETANRMGVAVENLFALPESAWEEPVPVFEDALAYIMFTSGTTGVPKGVMVSAGSVAHLIRVLDGRYRLGPGDRVSQVFELTFDLSVFDMFMTWSAGATLCVVPAEQLLGPAKFIREQRLTIWFSTPSTVAFMQKMRMLGQGVFPNLRCSLFCGEPLPVASAQAWQVAAPNSIVDNLYGPTEATVACTVQRLTNPPIVTTGRGILAIGEPFPGMGAAVVDSELKPVLTSEPGELILTGPQLARGYFGDPELTASRFPTIWGKRWYRTGDLVYQDVALAFHHLGRIDNQVKILGNRVELEEVEAHLRAITGTDLVAVVAWPIADGCASGIVAFLCGSRVEAQAAREAMRERVPSYMVPQRIEDIDPMPLSPSGKVDRKALLRRLEQSSKGAAA
jgi:amino acid adenylation domain-containing protein